MLSSSSTSETNPEQPTNRLLGHILINTYIPNQFKIRLKTASLFGYFNSGGCSKYVCNKLTKSSSGNNSSSGNSGNGGGS